MAKQIQIKVSLAWWLRWYLCGVLLMSRHTGLQPDSDKVAYWAGKATKIKVIE